MLAIVRYCCALRVDSHRNPRFLPFADRVQHGWISFCVL